MKTKAPFIVLEAINAGGKTTQLKYLLKALKKGGYTAHAYHFHQRDRATGQLIEHKFHHDPLGRDSFTQREQALLYIQDFYSKAEDFAQLRNHARGKQVIIADRFYTSTMAYQTIGLAGKRRQQMIDWIKWLCEKGKPHLEKPDLVILLDTPTHISVRHLAGAKRDFFEQEKKLNAIRQSYLRLAKEEKWLVVTSVNKEGNQRSVEDIHKEIWAKIVAKLPSRAAKAGGATD